MTANGKRFAPCGNEASSDLTYPATPDGAEAMPHQHTTRPEAHERFWCEHITDEAIERAIQNAEKRVSFVHWRGKDAVLRAVRAAVIGIALDFDFHLRERGGAPHDGGNSETSPRLRLVGKGGAA